MIQKWRNLSVFFYKVTKRNLTLLQKINDWRTLLGTKNRKGWWEGKKNHEGCLFRRVQVWSKLLHSVLGHQSWKTHVRAVTTPNTFASLIRIFDEHNQPDEVDYFHFIHPLDKMNHLKKLIVQVNTLVLLFLPISK